MSSVLKTFSLVGKRALVTGCKRGIGKAMAEALAEAGADVIGVSANLELEGSAVAKSVEAEGRQFFAYQADFGKRDSLYAFIHQVKEEHPVIDILINNAGTILRQPAAEHSDAYWDEVIAINQTAQFLLTREIGKEMVARGNGKILFTASLLTFQGGINVPSYAASKGAIGSLVKAFANEWAGQGVNVNAIAPGYISTDNTEALRADQARSQSILSRIPANRWGEPDDFKGPAVFLSSDASRYVHGTILTVDGGWMGR
ncbi:SDR family NAD(P)-dependent oxidoreductase [Spirosoma sp. KNUC1025]|uniref:SDR family NAD(P)-dependent oxidoreductase n=1 Tax=Spirosoma sp. KNUC1025 TaxID=2894082 RepID=UPI00386CEA95|nr:SDR family oxidoreductase [Spirosoma sp. KNUC1025]